MATAPATKRLPNIKGWVYDDEDSYCRVEDEESREMVTDAYDPAATYKKSETCIHDNKLYRAKADITTAEIWTPNHWEETSLETIRAEMAAEISKANSDISALNANKIFFRDVAYTAVQIGADGYGVTSAGIGKDEKVIGSSILTWGTGVIYGGPTLGDKGSGYGYLFGPPNTVVTGLSIRWKIVKS